MDIHIEYCGIWNYLPHAASLADEIKSSIGITPTLLEGSGGIFIVNMNGSNIFDKKSAGRFPTAGEVTQIIQSLQSS